MMWTCKSWGADRAAQAVGHSQAALDETAGQGVSRCHTIAKVLVELQVPAMLPQKLLSPPELDGWDDLYAQFLACLLALLAISLQQSASVHDGLYGMSTRQQNMLAACPVARDRSLAVCFCRYPVLQHLLYATCPELY